MIGGGSVESLIDLHDSEIIAAEKVLQKLNEKQGKSLNLEAFRREIIERFASEANLVVRVKPFTTNQEGLFAFVIEIIDRIAGQFDPDRQVHEAVNDLLDLGEGGVIQTGSGLHVVQGGHRHGKGHHHH